jgi:hypothetical protein
MLSGSQISPTIDISFLCSLCPNQIKIALIKLTDTKKKKEEKLEAKESANGCEVKEKSKQN